MRKLTTLLLLAFLVSGYVAPVVAFEPVDNLINSGKMSNDEVYSVYVELINSHQGTVTSTVYQTINETATTKIHQIIAQPYLGEGGTADKLSRFFFYFSNNSKDMVMGLKGAAPYNLVVGYVYGPRKSEIINAYVAGIPECLLNNHLYDPNALPDSDSWAEKYLNLVSNPDQFQQLIASGKKSNNEIYQYIVNLTNIQQGQIIGQYYTGAGETLTEQVKTVQAQTIDQAKHKLNCFASSLSSHYRTEQSQTCLTGTSDTFIVYSFGANKGYLLSAYAAGLQECLNNIPYTETHAPGDPAYTWFDKYIPANWMHRDSGSGDSSSSSNTPDQTIQSAQPATPLKAENQAVMAVFSPNSQTYMVSGEARQMDVKPYLKDGLLYVPVRFLAYSLGILDDGIQWDQTSKSVTITRDDITLVLTIESTTMLVNGQPVIMDIAPEIKDNRTMLPSDWITKALEKPGD